MDLETLEREAARRGLTLSERSDLWVWALDEGDSMMVLRGVMNPDFVCVKAIEQGDGEMHLMNVYVCKGVNPNMGYKDPSHYVTTSSVAVGLGEDDVRVLSVKLQKGLQEALSFRRGELDLSATVKDMVTRFCNGGIV